MLQARSVGFAITIAITSGLGATLDVTVVENMYGSGNVTTIIIGPFIFE